MTTNTSAKTKTLAEKQAAMEHARNSKKEVSTSKPSDGLFMTIPEITQEYRIGRTTLRDLIAVNDTPIKSVKAGRQVRYLTKDIKEMFTKYQQ